MTADTNHSSTANLRISHRITSLGTLSKAFSKSTTKKEEETTGRKYNGLPYYIGRHNKHVSLTKNTYNTKSTKKLNPGSVASYNLRPGNGVGLFWEKGKGWKSKKIDKAIRKGKVKSKR